MVVMETKLRIASGNFYYACVDKLEEKENAGWTGWDNPNLKDRFEGYIREKSGKCELTQEDLINMANYCSFLWNLIEEEKRGL